jgi:formylglycine-generating enzyme required for sulfatase activity
MRVAVIRRNEENMNPTKLSRLSLPLVLLLASGLLAEERLPQEVSIALPGDLKMEFILIPAGEFTMGSTEAQGEYACRAGSTTDYYSGNDPAQLAEYAWYDSNSGSTTHPVGEKKPNAWGLYDMHGNVWEWCVDYPDGYQSSDVKDPSDFEGKFRRTLRSGSWFDTAAFCRSWRRYFSTPTYGTHDQGLHIVMAVGADAVPAVKERN